MDQTKASQSAEESTSFLFEHVGHFLMLKSLRLKACINEAQAVRGNGISETASPAGSETQIFNSS